MEASGIEARGAAAPPARGPRQTLGREGHRRPSRPLRGGVGADDDGDRDRADRPDDRVLRRRLARRVLLHGLVSDLQPAGVRRPRHRRRNAQRHVLGDPLRDPDRARRGDLPERVREQEGSRDGEADPRDPRRDPDGGARLLRRELPHPDHPGRLAGRPVRRGREALPGARRLARHRPDDRPDHRLDLRGRDVGGPRRPARGRLRDGRRPGRRSPPGSSSRRRSRASSPRSSWGSRAPSARP